MCEFVLLKRIEPSPLRRFWILVPVLFVLSCRTLPELSHSSIVDILPPESNIIMQFAVPGNEALLEIFMLQFGVETGNFSVIGKRIEHLAIGLEVDPPLSGRQKVQVPFHVVAIGDWPKAVFGKLLGEGWIKTGRGQWIDPSGLEIMLISNRELIISSRRLNTMLLRTRIASRNMTVATSGMAAENADLAFWLTDPDLIQKFLPPLPVRKITEALIVDLLGGTLEKVDSDAYSLDMFIHFTDPGFAESMAFAMRLGFASQIGGTFDFLDYGFLTGLEIKEQGSEVVISHNSIPFDLLKNFLGFDFGLEVGGFDSCN